jgi:hypothetical protein
MPQSSCLIFKPKKMKKTLYSTLTLIGICALFTFCNKTNTPSPANPAGQPVPETGKQSSRASSIAFYLNGIDKIDEIDEFPVTDTSSFVGIDSVTVYVFAGNTDLLNWTQINVSDPSWLQEAKTVVQMHATNIRSFINAATDANIWDDDQLLEELYDDMFAEQGKTQAAGLLFKNPGYSGGTLPIPVKFPSMPSGWNNNITSMIGTGIVLCDLTWFRGTKFYWIAGGCYSLGGWYMDDKTSSVF